MSTEVLEHALEPQRMIDEIRRALRPGGRVLLTTRFIFPLHDVPGNYYRFTNYALVHLFRDWASVSVEPEATTFETLGVSQIGPTMSHPRPSLDSLPPIPSTSAPLTSRSAAPCTTSAVAPVPSLVPATLP
jgi:hypothetical protein